MWYHRKEIQDALAELQMYEVADGVYTSRVIDAGPKRQITFRPEGAAVLSTLSDGQVVETTEVTANPNVRWFYSLVVEHIDQIGNLIPPSKRPN